MNVEELFKECFKSDAIKAKEEFRPTPWLTVREREFAQFCIQKERKRCLKVVDDEIRQPSRDAALLVCTEIKHKIKNEDND